MNSTENPLKTVNVQVRSFALCMQMHIAITLKENGITMGYTTYLLHKLNQCDRRLPDIITRKNALTQ